VGSTEVILLDTHVAIWLANEDAALGAGSRDLILAAREQSELAISAISFWEVALLFARGRVELREAPSRLRTNLLETGVVELSLSGDTAVLAVELTGLHSDPADRFIVATAITHSATLLTADHKILDWPHPLRRRNATE
jgi:PIN domain nuclease of toxin-antitoxin system